MVTADAERRGQSPTAEEESRFKDFLAEAKTLGLEISEIERRFAENGKTLTDDTDLSTSMGRVSHTELADDGETRRILPGELRLLKPTEKFTAAYPPTSEQRKFSGLNLGKLIGLMAGQPTDGADLERRALTGNQDSLGGVTIPELIGAEIGDMARAKNVCIQAGAVTFLMPNRNVILPRIVQLEGTWKAENATADDADVSFAGCELRARTWFVYIPISNELFSDCSLLDTALRVSIASAVAVAIDGAALFGNGSEQQPTGLYYISEVTKTGADDANGYRDIADSLCRVESENHNPTAVVIWWWWWGWCCCCCCYCFC